MSCIQKAEVEWMLTSRICPQTDKLPTNISGFWRVLQKENILKHFWDWDPTGALGPGQGPSGSQKCCRMVLMGSGPWAGPRRAPFRKKKNRGFSGIKMIKNIIFGLVSWYDHYARCKAYTLVNSQKKNFLRLGNFTTHYSPSKRIYKIYILRIFWSCQNFKMKLPNFKFFFIF